MKTRMGYLAVIVSSFFFGFNGFFGKVGYELGYTPLMLLTVRFTVAALVMWGVAIVRGVKAYRSTSAALRWYVPQGIAYALTSLGFFNALRFMPAGLVGIFFYVHPLITMLFATLLFGERAGKKVLLAAFMAICGTALVSWSGGSLSASIPGLMWIAFSACSYSAFTLIGQKTTADQDSTVVTTYSITFCALFLASLNPPLYMVNGSMTSLMWMVGLGIGIICSVLAILLYVVGIKAIGASRTAIVSAAEPLSGVLLASLLLAERLVFWQWMGMALIVAAVVSLERREDKALTQHAE